MYLKWEMAEHITRDQDSFLAEVVVIAIVLFDFSGLLDIVNGTRTYNFTGRVFRCQRVCRKAGAIHHYARCFYHARAFAGHCQSLAELLDGLYYEQEPRGPALRSSFRAQCLPQVLFEPLHCLQESRFLGIFLLTLELATNSKAVYDSRVEIDLVWLLGLFQDLFRLMSLFGWEDLISLCC